MRVVLPSTSSSHSGQEEEYEGRYGEVLNRSRKLILGIIRFDDQSARLLGIHDCRSVVTKYSIHAIQGELAPHSSSLAPLLSTDPFHELSRSPHLRFRE
jgi:hypothetical protein